MQIRPALPGDAPAIARVHVRSWQAAYRDIFPDHYLDTLDVDDRARRWESTLQEPLSPTSTTLLATAADGVVAGFAHLAPTRDTDTDTDTDTGPTAEIAAIYVSPEAWSTGVGRELMKAALAVLSASPYTQATLWVLAENRRARRFYERAGWSADGTTRSAVIADTPVTEVRYRRGLVDHPSA